MGKAKVLIIHGWMNSADTYAPLKQHLEGRLGCEVTLFEFPGFGSSDAGARAEVLQEDSIIDYYVRLVREEIRDDQYNFLIGHSMGGHILLRAMCGMELKGMAIFLSPAYDKISLIKPPLLPLFPHLFRLLQRRESAITTFFIRCFFVAPINRWDKIDDTVVRDFRRSDPTIASRVIEELVHSAWHISRGDWKSGRTYLVIGEHDRLIPRDSMERLGQDLADNKTILIEGIGHTAILEDLAQLTEILDDIVASAPVEHDG